MLPILNYYIQRMNKVTILLVFLFLHDFLLFSQTNSDSCYKAMPFCGEKIAIPRVPGGVYCEPCANYGCVSAGTTQFTWIYFKALTSGAVSLHFTDYVLCIVLPSLFDITFSQPGPCPASAWSIPG